MSFNMFDFLNKLSFTRVSGSNEELKAAEMIKEQVNSFGLNERVERLGRIYDEVSFEKEIDQFPQSIDKKIDDVISNILYDKNGVVKQDILKKLHQYIVSGDIDLIPVDYRMFFKVGNEINVKNYLHKITILLCIIYLI